VKTAPLADVKAHPSALVDEVVRTHEQVTITRNGEPVAVVPAVEDHESLLQTLALLGDRASRERLAEADEAVARGELATRDEMAEIRDHGGPPPRRLQVTEPKLYELLVAPPAKRASARRGTYRVRYRVDEERHAVIVLDIVGRSWGQQTRDSAGVGYG
jgi:antitoxin YefM